jgi:plastocyanin
MKKLVIILAAASVSIALTGTAAAIPTGSATTAGAAKNRTITIMHQTRGCHAWAVNGGRYSASLKMHITRGATIRFIDNDVMSHKLIKKSGSAVHFTGNRAMSHMGASVKATFSKAGTYKFVTKAGEDYAGVHVKTVGEDNVLRLTVNVG